MGEHLESAAASDMDKVRAYRQEFPALQSSVYGKPLIYLDNAATNQVSIHVIDAISRHLRQENANTHRGAHFLSEQATLHFEETRTAAARFINAPHSENIVFTSGTTAGLNTVALGLEPLLSTADAILVTRMEHHSNFLPWQQLCSRTGAEFRIAPLTETGEIDRDAFRALLADGRVKVVAFPFVSNVTGIVNPARELIVEAHRAGALTVLDAAQAMRSGLVDVQDLNCDFCCFSAHKMNGPTGVGILYGASIVLKLLAPRSFGGGMVDQVELSAAEFSDAPFRFEAGTPNILGIAGFKAAMEDLQRWDTEWIRLYETRLLDYAARRLHCIKAVTVLGNVASRFGALSFVVQDRHPYDLASIMDKQGVAVRAGHHCAIPHLQHYGQTAALRISPAFYNTFEEIDTCTLALEKAIVFFKKWDGRP